MSPLGFDCLVVQDLFGNIEGVLHVYVGKYPFVLLPYLLLSVSFNVSLAN